METYIYNKQINPITLQEEIDTNMGITIALTSIESTDTSVSAHFKTALPLADEVVLSGVVDAHIYTDIINETDEMLTDQMGKLIVHPTIKPLGYQTYFTGAGDDPNDHTNIGNGEHLHIVHTVGDPLTGEIIVDFNCMDNRTFVYEGYISWNNVPLVELDVEIVTRATEFVPATGTGFDIYGGYLIIPSLSGTIQVTSDLSQPHGGLTKMPINEDGTKSTAYWDADWDSITGTFSNIRPNLTGEGEYNLFAGEITLVRFVNNYVITGLGSQELDSEDADEIGHGMRLKVSWLQHDDVADSDYVIGTTITMHREKTV